MLPWVVVLRAPPSDSLHPRSRRHISCRLIQRFNLFYQMQFGSGDRSIAVGVADCPLDAWGTSLMSEGTDFTT